MVAIAALLTSLTSAKDSSRRKAIEAWFYLTRPGMGRLVNPLLRTHRGLLLTVG